VHWRFALSCSRLSHMENVRLRSLDTTLGSARKKQRTAMGSEVSQDQGIVLYFIATVQNDSRHTRQKIKIAAYVNL
jgi:hypothetical protein